MIKRKSLDMLNPYSSGVERLVRQLQCELCGAPFECGMGGVGCWCTNLQLTTENLATLRQLAKDCVCPQCLTKLAGENKESTIQTRTSSREMRGNVIREARPAEFIREYFAGKLLTHDIKLRAEATPTRFGEQAYFNLHLNLDRDESTSIDPIFSGLYSTGRPSQSIHNWIDGDYFDTAVFTNGTRLSLSETGLDVQLFMILGELIHPGGSLMISYSLFEKESKIHRDTKFGLDRGYPPVVTPLGFLLFTAGCGMGFKDWYFAEGGREGPEKLQGYKPIDPETARKKAEQIRAELTAFLSHTQQETDALTQTCRTRAAQVIE